MFGSFHRWENYRLFTEKLEKDEVLIITGCEQFCKYRGYGSTFQYAGDIVDDTKLDEYGRRKTEIVAMDAYNFSEYGSHTCLVYMHT